MVFKKSIDDPTITPLDIGSSYVDSVYNYGTVSIAKLISNSSLAGSPVPILDAPLFQPGTAGSRTVPNEGGFAYSDTPEATVFIQKREWMEDDWTYVSNKVERAGKVEELKTRVYLANLITRKLDWLNNHEIFTKLSDLNASLTSQYTSQVQAFAAADFSLSGSQVTKYYTESFSLDSETVNITNTPQQEIPIATVVEVVTTDYGSAGRLKIRTTPDFSAPIICSLHGPHTGGSVTKVQVQTTGPGDPNKPDNVIPGKYDVFDGAIKEDFPAGLAPEVLAKFQSAQWWKIDLTFLGANPSYLFPQTNRDLAVDGAPSDASQADLQNYAANKLKNGINNGIGWIPRVNQGDLTNQLAVDVQRTTVPAEVAPKVDVTPGNSITLTNIFNGVMELTNIQSINTTLRNDGTVGFAQLVVTNPNNNLTITEDDILIAMGENPFLKGATDDFGQPVQNIVETDPTTGQKLTFRYYKGRYYSDRAYKIVTKQDFTALGNVDISSSGPIAAKTELLNEFQSVLTNVQTYGSTGQLGFDIVQSLYYINGPYNITTTVNVPSNVPSDPHFKSKSADVQQKIAELNSAIIQINAEIQNLASSGNTVPQEADSKEFRIRKNQLKRFYQNRTIFQVYDRVFIWLTSPSRTIRTLQDGTIVSEDFTSQQTRMARIQEIISLIRQLDGMLQTISAQSGSPVHPIFDDNTIAAINIELFNDGKSQTYSDKEDALLLEFTSPLVNILTKTIDQKIDDLSAYTNAKELPNTKLPTPDTDTMVQGIDPKSLFSSTTGEGAYVGLTDQQFQVFQGVITRISRNYHDGVFTINLECKDNLDYLTRSRFITVPGLGQYNNNARPILDDPIWRQKDAKVTDNISTDIKPDNIFGRWKTGIMTLTANIVPPSEVTAASADASQAKQPATDTTNNYPEEVVSRSFGRSPQAENEPFEGADPAQIISILTTGYPFNLPKYLENTIFKGSLIVNPKLQSDPTVHTGESFKVGPFEQVRQEIWPQVRKYGDFEPFFEQSTPVTKDEHDQANIATQINLTTAILLFFKVYVTRRQNLGPFASSVQFDKQKSADPSSANAQPTEKNFDQVLVPADFPSDAKQIQLSSSFKSGIGPQIEFFITAAMQGQDPAMINSLMSDAFDATRFNQVVPGSSNNFQSFTNRADLAMTADEQGNYADITKAAQDRVNRGVVYSLLSANPQPNSGKTFPRPAQAPSLTDLLGANGTITNPDPKSYKGIRDKTLHPADILQCTKSSIIYKTKPNFFTVSDKYLLTSGLVDYVREVGNPGGSFQDNDYSTVLDRCLKAAHTIDWEFYADSQGHLRFKPPTYNRVLLKHLLDLTNIEPIYAQTLFEILKAFNATDIIKAPLYVGYKTAALSVKNQARDLIKNVQAIALTTIVKEPSSLSSFFFASLIPSAPSSLMSLMIKNNDITADDLTNINAFLQAPSEAAMDLEPDTSNSLHSTFEQIQPSKMNSEVNTAVQNAISNQSNETEVPPTITDMQNGLNALFKLNGKLNTQLAKQQQSPEGFDNDSLASLAADVIQAAVDLCSVCTNVMATADSQVAGLQPALDPVLASITDTRFVHNIPSSLIIDEDWEENAPEFTRLNVNTAFAFSGINQDSVEGQRLHWVGSVDYDLWRMYGYKVANVQVPFLQTGEQAAVYADMLMARQYGTILQGSVTVRGDSKYQLGDCVFIEDENLYYYISGIQHQFSYGQRYTTTLNLTYGRRPGMFIPFPFDALGQAYTRGANFLYNDIDVSNLTDIVESYDAQSKEGPDVNN